MWCWFQQWPARPAWLPANTKEGIIYLQQMLSNPEDFADFIRLAKEPSFWSTRAQRNAHSSTLVTILASFCNGLFSFTLARRRGRQETPLLRDRSHKNRLRSNAWRVRNTPWEVTMCVKAVAKYTRTLKEYNNNTSTPGAFPTIYLELLLYISGLQKY